MTDITIPAAAAKALADAIYELTGEGIDMAEARAAFNAMVKAWPNIEWRYRPYYSASRPEALILPLTEKPNAEA